MSDPSQPSASSTPEDLLRQAATLLSSGQAQQALRDLSAGLQRFPDHAGLFNLAGVCAASSGDLAQAENFWRRAVTLDPNTLQAHYNLGLLYANAQRTAEAEQSYRQVLARDPNNAATLCNLGVLLANAARYDEAQACYQQVLNATPNHEMALLNLGALWSERKEDSEAKKCYLRVLEINPNNAKATANLANLLARDGEYDEAEALFRKALSHSPNNPMTHFNLGVLLEDRYRYDEAESHYRQAATLDPHNLVARLNLGYLLLRTGRFEEGWRYHEIRTSPELPLNYRSPLPMPKVDFPPWQGENLAGKSLLIWPEQGLGDEIQCCRYVPLLKQQGASRITLICKTPLKPLLENLEGVDSVLALDELAGPLPHHDFWTYPLSLPFHCHTKIENIPSRLPYLQALPQKVSHWATRLPSDGLRVGVVWKGNPDHKNDASRSLSGLDVLAPLWEIPGVRFIGLQKGRGEDEAQKLAATQPLLNLGPELADFADTAAVIAQLDLVISIDSAVAHLTGALGKPCWVMIPAYRGDWRWLAERNDSPWYPGVMRLFRQTQEKTWAPVVKSLKAALHQEASKHS